MLNSALVEILKILNKDEIKSLEDFISSPYHNKKTPPIKLFKHIRKYYPDLKSNDLDREKVWNALFPGKLYNYGVMKNLIYDLTKLTEEYIASAFDRRDEIRKDFHVIKFLSDRNRTKLAEKYLDKADKRIKRSATGDADYFYNIFKTERVRLSILYSNISDKHKIPGSEFYESSKHLIESFLISILENYVMINGLNKIHKSGIAMPLLEEVLKFIKSDETFLENLYIKVYYYILLLDREQDEKYYSYLKKILSKINKDADIKFKYTLWENISNYIIFRFHAGEKEVLKEQFELNKISLAKKIYSLTDDGKFLLLNFNSIINIAFHLGEIEWAESFVNKYYKELDENIQEDIKHYSLAGIYIWKRDFGKANEHLSKVKKLYEPHMKAGLKHSVLIVYFELGWFESAYNVVDSFKHLLDNEKNLQSVIKEKYRRFIKGYKLLLDTGESSNENAKLKLRIFLNEESEVASYSWLKRKAKELGIL